MPPSQDARSGLLQPSPVRVLIVEDDPGDALLVREHLSDSSVADDLEVDWAPTISEARERCATKAADCVLVDLGLPDATGLDAVATLRSVCPDAALVVLTGQRDRSQALAAVTAGAQDYLIKDEVNPTLLDRTVRLAIQRRMVERATVQLAEAVVQGRHNRQVARGLLPNLRVRDPQLTMVTRYRPGTAGEVLGGDFLDAVELDSGVVHLVIGDVAGHGPEEAAVGVNLRIAWRALTVSGNPPEAVFRVLNDQVVNDAGLAELFATVASASIAADRRSLSVRIAGHPAPILWAPGASGPAELEAARTTVVGLDLDDIPPETTLDLPPSWRLLLYTDGLVEGRDAVTGGRWGVEGVLGFVADHPGLDGEALADGLLEEAASRNRGPLPDDVAILLVIHDG